MTNTSPTPSSNGASQFLLLFGLFWAIFGSVFLLVGFLVIRSETDLYNRLTQEGQLTSAIVTKLTTDNSDDATRYYVDYEFKAPINGDPTSFKGSESVSAELYRLLHVEQKLDVIYVASDPTISRLKLQSTQPNTTVGWIFGGLGGFFLVLGLVIGGFGLRARRKLV